MKVIRLTFLVLILSLSASAAGFWIWLQTIYLPGPARQVLSQRLTESLGRSVEIQGIALDLTGHISLRDVRIASGSPQAERPVLAEVGEIKLKIKPSDLFRKQITVHAIQIRELILHGRAQGTRAHLTVQGAIRIPFDSGQKAQTEGLMLITSGSFSGIGHLGEISELNGSIEMGRETVIKLKSASEKLPFLIHARISRNSVDIRNVEGAYQGIAFKASGSVPSLREPSLKLTGTLDFDLADVLPKNKKVNGTVHVNSSMLFTGADLKNMRAEIDAASSGIRMHRFHFNDIRLAGYIRNGQLLIKTFHAGFHGGVLRGTGEQNLLEPGKPYQGRLNLYRAELKRLLPPKTVSAKRISGKVSGELFFHAREIGLRALQGRGRLLMAEGQIWEIPVLAGLGSLLKIPQLESIPLHGAHGDFAISDGWILTDGFILDSTHYQLVMTGGVGFDSSIDLEVTTHVPETREGIIPSGLGLLSEALQEYGKVDIAGTLKEPKYHVQFLRPDLLLWDTLQQNILGPLLEGLGTNR